MVRYYPPLDDHTGIREEKINVKDMAQVTDLLKEVIRIHKELRSYLSTKSDEALRRHVIIMIEGNMARLEDYLKDGNTVKLLPPVAGG